jgi:hypothetical protein
MGSMLKYVTGLPGPATGELAEAVKGFLGRKPFCQ